MAIIRSKQKKCIGCPSEKIDIDINSGSWKNKKWHFHSSTKEGIWPQKEIEFHAAIQNWQFKNCQYGTFEPLHRMGSY